MIHPWHPERTHTAVTVRSKGWDIATDLDLAREMLLACHLICPHTDADGLAAGALALAARQEDASAASLLARGHTPFDKGVLPPARPVALLDWGIRRFEGATLFVDHHAPETAPSAHQIVVSAYGASPKLSTSVLTGRIVSDPAAWVVAVGAVGDLGDSAWTLPDLEGVQKTPIRKLVPLINAPRRLPRGPVRDALGILLENPDARSALADPRIRLLHDAKDEWRSGFAEVLRTAPHVSGGVALIEFSSPYQVHPLVAQAWSRRLAGNVVIAANCDYIPGMVNFAVRGGTGDLRALLRSALPEENGEFAHGHPRATGGSLVPETFQRMLQALRGQP